MPLTAAQVMALRDAENRLRKAGYRLSRIGADTPADRREALVKEYLDARDARESARSAAEQGLGRRP